MYHVGRFLQMVGLVLTGFAFFESFKNMSERTMWMFCLSGLLVFAIGHWLIPKKS